MSGLTTGEFVDSTGVTYEFGSGLEEEMVGVAKDQLAVVGGGRGGRGGVVSVEGAEIDPFESRVGSDWDVARCIDYTMRCVDASDTCGAAWFGRLVDEFVTKEVAGFVAPRWEFRRG